MSGHQRALVFGLGGLGAAFLLAAPVLLNSFYLRVVAEVLIFGLFAVSINVLVGYAGLPSLGHAGIFGVAAYGVGYFLARSQAPWTEWQAIIFAMVATLVVTVIFGLMAVRTSGIYFLMITLAQGIIVWGLALRLAGITNAENGIRGIRRPPLIGPYPRFYYLVLATTVVVMLLVYLIVNSSFGLTLKGIREREGRMAALGYRVSLQKFLGFMVAGFLGGVAGILYVFHNEFVSPSGVEFATSAEGLLMVILGGTGTLYGPLLGSAIVVFTRQQISLYTDRWLIILGAIYVITILLAPDGLVSGMGRLARRLRGETSEEPSPTAGVDALAAGSGETAPTTEGRGETVRPG